LCRSTGNNAGECQEDAKLFNEPFEVSIVSGNAVLLYSCGYQAVVPIRVFRQMVGRGQAAIAEHDARPDNVIPLCDLCVRHNLPRLGSAH
jgi:hypothetical protein